MIVASSSERISTAVQLLELPRRGLPFLSNAGGLQSLRPSLTARANPQLLTAATVWGLLTLSRRIWRGPGPDPGTAGKPPRILNIVADQFGRRPRHD